MAGQSTSNNTDARMIHLYVDGGVIQKNPSTIGGTCAWVIVKDGGILEHDAWVVPCEAEPITNNLTEMLAAIDGLAQAHKYQEHITLYSDSKITLGRLFDGWAWNGIPLSIKIHAKNILATQQVKDHVLLRGHPTKKELERGYTAKGIPVSIYNVWCDKDCKRVGENYVKSTYTANR